MRHSKLRLSLLLFAFCLIIQPHAESQTNVSSSVVSAGGEAVSNDSIRVVGTVGQTVIGSSNNSINVSNAGFWYQTKEIVTNVEQIPNSLPKKFRLEQNYPNPFNPTTTIQFALPKPSSVTLKLFDILGREIAVLVDEDFQPGEYKVVFDARSLSSGVYFYQIRMDNFHAIKKMVLLQ